MPHLSFEYNDITDKAIDMQAFATAMRDACMATGEAPLAGVRVAPVHGIEEGRAAHSAPSAAAAGEPRPPR